jgi:uncharacterized secreted protein with C-terminal beta-propeller domain
MVIFNKELIISKGKTIFPKPKNMKKTTAAMAIFVIALSLLPVTVINTTLAADAQTIFSDVPAEDVSATAIDYLKKNNVVSGYPDGTFLPDSEINRAEFTKIVVGAVYANPQGKNCFPDVKDGWFAPYVCQAKSVGLIEGYPDGLFKPADNINFSEAAKIVANAYKLSSGATGAEWFKPYVTALEAKKDIPLSVDYFDKKLTRREMAEMVYRLKANVTDKASRTFEEISGQGFATVSSCADLKERFVEQNLYDNVTNGGGIMYLKRESAMPAGTSTSDQSAAPVMAPASPASDGGLGAGTGSVSASNDYSTTNLQVAGVDEADVIKNDGRYIYLIKGSSVRIVDAYPASNLKEIVSFSFGDETVESYYPREMYVSGNTLTVIGDATRYVVEPVPMPMPMVDSSTQTTGTTTTDVAPTSIIAPMPPYFGGSRTKVYVVDITDKTKPKIIRHVEYDGYYLSSRRINDTLYLIMNRNFYFPYYYGTTSSGTTTESPDAIVPKILDSKNGVEKLVAPCADIRFFPKTRDFNYLIASAIPLADPNKDVSSTVVVGNSDNIYASSSNLYVASTNWVGGYYRYDGGSDTMIYKFSLKDQKVDFVAAGNVPGTILNQFSMDEYGSNFRIATNTSTYYPETKMANGVYILDSAMSVVGKVDGIAPGEKLYTSRFTGNTGYLVTFKYVDPLFVLDLSNARDPKIKGQLKVPGYSTYLEPYDDTHLLGFGNDVDMNDPMNTDYAVYYTAIKGMKISMFDVSDITKPVEMFTDIIGDRGTYSEVLNNHKALLFDKAKGLLAFPVTVYQAPTDNVCASQKYSTCPDTCNKVCVPTTCTDQNGIKVCTADCDGANSCVSYQADYTKPVFDGAYVYNVSLNDGFKLQGKITHYSDTEASDLLTNGYTNYEKTIQRVIYIGEYLYTISQGAVKANNLSDLVEKGLIQLAGTVYNVK